MMSVGSSMMYKFVSIQEYKDKYETSHPDARLSPNGDVVVLSINTPEEGCVSWKEASTTVKGWDEEMLRRVFRS